MPAGPIELGDFDDRAQPRNLCGQELGDPERRRERDEHPCLRVGEDARVTAHVILELPEPGRRINRHRNCSGHLHREEGREVVQPGRKHQRRALAGFQSAIREARREVFRALHQRRERNTVRTAVRLVELDVNAVAVVVCVIVHRLEQRGGVGRNGVHRETFCLPLADRGRLAPAPVAGHQGRQQFAYGFRVCQHRLGDGRAEPVFETRQQLHARQAVESEVAVKRAVQGEPAALREVRMKLGDDFTHRLHERLLVDGARPVRLLPSRHCSTCHRSGPAAVRTSSASTASAALDAPVTTARTCSQMGISTPKRCASANT